MEPRSFLEMDDVSAVARALKAMRERAGFSAPELARAIGRSPTSYLHYEDRFKKPYLPIDFVQAIKPHLTARGIAEQEIDALAGIVTNSLTIGQGTSVYAPVILWSRAAVLGTMIDKQALDGIEKIPVHYTKTTVFALTVAMDDMNLVAPEGAVIIVDYTDIEPLSGKYYVIRHAGKAIFRRFRADPPRWEPYSSNPNHETVFPDATTQIIGRVVLVQNQL